MGRSRAQNTEQRWSIGKWQKVKRSSWVQARKGYSSDAFLFFYLLWHQFLAFIRVIYQIRLLLLLWFKLLTRRKMTWVLLSNDSGLFQSGQHFELVIKKREPAVSALSRTESNSLEGTRFSMWRPRIIVYVRLTESIPAAHENFEVQQYTYTYKHAQLNLPVLLKVSVWTQIN